MSILRLFGPLIAAAFLITCGNGALSTLTPLRGHAEGFDERTIGLIASFFYGGMLGGAAIVAWITERWGHARAFVLCALLGAAAAALIPLWPQPIGFMLLRFFCGVSLCGLYVVIEAWLGGGVSEEQRGRAFGIYSLVQYAGWASGPQILQVTTPTAAFGFETAAVFVALSALPILLARTDPPRSGRKGRMTLRALWRISPLAILGTALVGSVNAPMWSLVPVFSVETGLSNEQAATLSSMILLGSALAQIPIGRLSDAFDRRAVLLGLCAASALLEAVFWHSGATMPVPVRYGVGLVMGGVVSAQYYVLASHSIDRAGRDRAVPIMAALVVLYGIGAVIGPALAAETMRHVGPTGVFLYQWVVHLLICAIIIRQMMARLPPVPQADAPVAPPG